MTSTEIVSALQAMSIGDMASVAGLIITLLGFAITIFKVSRVRAASDQVNEAVQKVREDLRLMESVSDFSSALSLLEDVKRLHRQNAWHLLPEKYSSLRKLLISIKSSTPSISDDQSSIQAAISHLSTLERLVDEQSYSKESKVSVPKVNSLVSKQIDTLQEVLIRIKDRIGVEK